jgi:hypothetical protein
LFSRALNTAPEIDARFAPVQQRGTWVSLKNKGSPVIAIEGDPRLLNRSDVIELSPHRIEPAKTRGRKSAAQEAAARGVRLRELRWKNSAWLATADTIAGWNGFEIRNAGSGRSPVRKRSG